MGETSVILEGADTPAARAAFFSTVHGAGRRMSRTQAKGKKGRPGLIDYDRVRADLRARGIELRGGAADEAPDAYKRLDAVLAEHGDSIRVLHRLTPIGVAMAGPDIADPYRD
jgi:tRNA-splicing ligase RtcB